MFKKIIFVEGVDQAGKTTKVRQIINADPNQFVYFRSNYQKDSRFAGELVNLEESMKHDWRILFDFINQTSDPNKILIVDRGFLSSYVYSLILRHEDLEPYLDAYLEMFKSISEFWLFLRLDSGMTEQWEKDVNEAFGILKTRLTIQLCSVKTFYRDDGNKFSTTDFSNLKAEVAEGRFNTDYYDCRLMNFTGDLSLFERANGIIVSDLDGTIIDLGYPNIVNAQPRFEVVNHINNIVGSGTPLLIITGREKVEDYIRVKISNLLDRRVIWIWNNKNIGLSSTVLKQYCFNYLKSENIGFIYLDDREDVVQKIFPGEYTYNERLKIYEVRKRAD